jgi:hypothetical protein
VSVCFVLDTESIVNLRLTSLFRECNPPNRQLVDGNNIWVKMEIFINGIFSVELFLRIAVADSVLRYLK